MEMKQVIKNQVNDAVFEVKRQRAVRFIESNSIAKSNFKHVYRYLNNPSKDAVIEFRTPQGDTQFASLRDTIVRRTVTSIVIVGTILSYFLF